jgi:ABC-type sugar transport system permease subunit
MRFYINAHYWTLARPQPPRFAGLSNYGDMFFGERFRNTVLVSLKFIVLAIAPAIPATPNLALARAAAQRCAHYRTIRASDWLLAPA